MIDPGEDEIATDAGLFFKSLAALRAATFFEKLIYSLDAGSNEFFGVHGADSLNVDNFVSHNL
jgi:hypothetical protein